MSRLPDDAARHVLARWTDARPVVLGEGMEGVVYRVDDDRVAKIWFTGSVAALQRTQFFHTALAALPLPFATPRVEQVEVVDGHLVSVERRLDGTDLATATRTGRVDPAHAREVFVDVVAALDTSGPLPAARPLPVLGGPDPLYRGDEDFPAALAALVGRRLARFHDVLDRAVHDLDRKVEALATRLREVDSGRRSVVHGDLVPANVLVDATDRASAVLDWGFLTTEGDPVFDAAVAAAVFDMYGPDALATELALLQAFEDRLGHDRTAMLVYRAAYSLVTANAYDAEGRDGHFAWCARALDRRDVVAALLG